MNSTPVISPHEAAIVLAFASAEEELALEELARRGEISVAQTRSAVERLKMKGALDQTGEQVSAQITLNDFGRACVELQIPELRLWQMLLDNEAMPVRDLQRRDDLDAAETGAAFGALRKAGLILVEGGLVRPAPQADITLLHARQALLARIAAAGALAVDALSADDVALLADKRMRALVDIEELKVRRYRPTADGWALRAEAEAARDEIGRLTPAMIQDGSWRGRRFRPYNIGLPPRLMGGARNPYRRFLDRIKQTLLALGFEEMRGSLVENEFWNMDALFMPQFHPARDIHDVYFVAEPTDAQQVEEPYLSAVAAAHQGDAYGTRGWGYLFNRQRARRLILRSQGTALSARQLTRQPNIPGKYFSIARCFRYDSVDATHAPDFYQVEGIVLSEQITLRHLLGMLMIFAREMAGAKEVKAVPGYYPYTEPSVEMHMRHPVLGWMELGGAGIFRPEVTQPLGIDVPVIAWGLGLDRMAMVALGINDIRHLFTSNLPNGVADLRAY